MPRPGCFPIVRHCLEVFFLHQVPKKETAIVPCVRDLFSSSSATSGICRISLLAQAPALSSTSGQMVVALGHWVLSVLGLRGVLFLALGLGGLGVCRSLFS